MAGRNFRNVSLRADLVSLVEIAIVKMGYRSIADFVSEAVRLRLEQLGLLKEEGEVIGPQQ